MITDHARRTLPIADMGGVRSTLRLVREHRGLVDARFSRTPAATTVA